MCIKIKSKEKKQITHFPNYINGNHSYPNDIMKIADMHKIELTSFVKEIHIYSF